jgi:hypothetical protein
MNLPGAIQQCKPIRLTGKHLREPVTQVVFDAEITNACLQPMNMIDATPGKRRGFKYVNGNIPGTGKKVNQGICDLLRDHIKLMCGLMPYAGLPEKEMIKTDQ